MPVTRCYEDISQVEAVLQYEIKIEKRIGGIYLCWTTNVIMRRFMYAEFKISIDIAALSDVELFLSGRGQMAKFKCLNALGDKDCRLWYYSDIKKNLEVYALNVMI